MEVLLHILHHAKEHIAYFLEEYCPFLTYSVLTYCGTAPVSSRAKERCDMPTVSTHSQETLSE